MRFDLLVLGAVLISLGLIWASIFIHLERVDKMSGDAEVSKLTLSEMIDFKRGDRLTVTFEAKNGSVNCLITDFETFEKRIWKYGNTSEISESDLNLTTCLTIMRDLKSPKCILPYLAKWNLTAKDLGGEDRTEGEVKFDVSHDSTICIFFEPCDIDVEGGEVTVSYSIRRSIPLRVMLIWIGIGILALGIILAVVAALTGKRRIKEKESKRAEPPK
jgi:hypothetical protein